MSDRMEKRIRVLIVDDSSFVRMAIRDILCRDPEIEVVGTATDGAEGAARAAVLKPDLVTMDVEMPRMDGIAAVRQIMATAPTRVIMVSTLTSDGATATLEALEAGAVDFVPKNISGASEIREQFRIELLRKVKGALKAAPHGRAFSVPELPAVTVGQRLVPPSVRRVGYIGIGASTGGPVAVQEVLSRLPVDFPCPIVVAVHMPKAFTGAFACRLDQRCRLQVKEAADGDLLVPGRALIAPGGGHTLLVRQPAGIAVQLVPTTAYPRTIYTPSVDLMLSSLADAANGATLGVILTGMGNDGLKGMQHLKSRGGMTLAQNEATSTVFGMPRACIDGGAADTILPLDKIGTAIIQAMAD